MTESIVKNNNPIVFAVLPWDTGLPSLYHLTTGIGIPDAVQLMFNLFPEVTFISFGGSTVKTG